MIEYIEYIFKSIGIIFGIALINRISLSYRLICLQLFVSLITDSIAEWSGDNFGSNYLVYNLYMPIEVILLSWAGVLSIYQNIWRTRFKMLIYFWFKMGF